MHGFTSAQPERRHKRSLSDLTISTIDVHRKATPIARRQSLTTA
jgi:hypothetical protein